MHALTRLLAASFLLTSLPLAAQQTEEEKRVSVLIMDLRAVDVDKSQVDTINELVTTAFAKYDSLKVLSSKDLEAAVQLEGEKQAAGCDDESASCLAELAGALGAQYVVFGSVGRLGRLYVVNLNLYDSTKSESVVREKIQAERLEELPGKIEDKVKKMVGIFAERTGAVELAVEEPQESGASGLFWTGAIVGGLGAATGITFGTLALVADGIVGSPTGEGKDTWKTFGVVSTFVAGGGGVLALAGGGLAGMGMME